MSTTGLGEKYPSCPSHETLVVALDAVRGVTKKSAIRPSRSSRTPDQPNPSEPYGVNSAADLIEDPQLKEFVKTQSCIGNEVVVERPCGHNEPAHTHNDQVSFHLPCLLHYNHTGAVVREFNSYPERSGSKLTLL